MDSKIITKSSLETKSLGSVFAKKLRAGDVVLLYGDLGAGKTTFTQGVAEGLEVENRIISPTFVLVRTYKINDQEIKNLNHIDLYRIKNPTEIENLGLEEILNEKGSIALIEWADRLEKPNISHSYKIYFKHLKGDSRQIRITR